MVWVEPGKPSDPGKVAKIDGKGFRETAQRIQTEWLDRLTDQETMDEIGPLIFQPKGQTNLEAVLAVSIIGPIGVPQEEAVYPQVATSDGEQVNAMNHAYPVGTGWPSGCRSRACQTSPRPRWTSSFSPMRRPARATWSGSGSRNASRGRIRIRRDPDDLC
jgi:hypothetical protein